MSETNDGSIAILLPPSIIKLMTKATIVLLHLILYLSQGLD